jgi:hypothetical protein
MNEQTGKQIVPLAPVEAAGLEELRSLVVDIALEEVASPALRRLLEEVRDDSACGKEQTYAYDRTHKKHNRGR